MWLTHFAHQSYDGMLIGTGINLLEVLGDWQDQRVDSDTTLS